MSSLELGKILPSNLRGMKVLQREKFDFFTRVPILKVSKVNLSKILQIVRPYILKLLNFKPVQDFHEDSGSDWKCLYLSPVKVSSWMDFPEDDRARLEKYEILDEHFCHKEIKLDYSNLTQDDIFKAVLPENEEIVSGFSQIGHIIHLNLRDHLLEYKSLVGQVLIDKLKTCRTVVNKSVTIDNTYRNFQMEVIAGDKDYMVTVKENLCSFHFDFSKVYWNPRLCKEHERILSLLKPGDVLFDVFCGVGPFSIPAAKRKCQVFANDLNPDSFYWLNINAKLNKLNMTLFKSYNLDGKDFIQTVLKKYLTDCLDKTKSVADGSKIHITMNLPALAVEFLRHFNGLLENRSLEDQVLSEIYVYVYCFVYGEDDDTFVNEAKKNVISNLGVDISDSILDVFNVRKVAPAKVMMRVTFKLTKDALVSKCKALDSEPPCKKLCS